MDQWVASDRFSVYQFLMVIMPGLGQWCPSSTAPEVGRGTQLDQGDQGPQPVSQGGVVDGREAVLILGSFVGASSGQKENCWGVATLARAVQWSEAPEAIHCRDGLSLIRKQQHLFVVADTEAPALISAFTTSECPYKEAQWRAVSPPSLPPELTWENRFGSLWSPRSVLPTLLQLLGVVAQLANGRLMRQPWALWSQICKLIHTISVIGLEVHNPHLSSNWYEREKLGQILVDFFFVNNFLVNCAYSCPWALFKKIAYVVCLKHCFVFVLVIAITRWRAFRKYVDDVNLFLLSLPNPSENVEKFTCLFPRCQPLSPGPSRSGQLCLALPPSLGGGNPRWHRLLPTNR